MASTPPDLSSFRKALHALRASHGFWLDMADSDLVKPHLRSGVIQSFEFTYELAMRTLRRILVERKIAPDEDVPQPSFNHLLRDGADAGLLPDALRWRMWRELRNSTSHAYSDSLAQAVVEKMPAFVADAEALLRAMENELAV